MTDKPTPGVSNPAPEEASDAGGVEWTKVTNRDVFLGFRPGENEEFAKVRKAGEEWHADFEGERVGPAFGSSNSARMFLAGFEAGYQKGFEARDGE